MENERRHIPNRLRMYRKLMRYSQKQAATLLSVSPAQLSQWENGVKMPGGIQLLKLSIIYRTLPTELFLDTYLSLKEQLNNLEWELFGQELPSQHTIQIKNDTGL